MHNQTSLKSNLAALLHFTASSPSLSPEDKVLQQRLRGKDGRTKHSDALLQSV